MAYQKISYTKSFQRQYKKLSPQKKNAFKLKLQIFEDNMYAKELRNHPLKGRFVGYRSIDIENNLRALYRIDNERIAIFAFIGSRSQLY